MSYYIKKNWKLNTLAVFFMIVVCSCQVLSNLAMIIITENIIDFNLKGFLKWLIIDASIFLIMIVFDQIGAICKGKAVQKMNNSVRLDMAASLSHSCYQEYHAQESGEYLSQLTNDVNEIESTAWESFYECITTVASVVFSIVALISLHWSLAVVSIVAAIVLLNAPKLFSKKMEALGAECTQKQASGTSKMKDLLSGFDVLRSFGRVNLFTSEMKEASNMVEKTKYHLNWVTNLAQDGITLVSLVVQVGINCLIGFLSINGIILQGALLGGGNLCGSVSNGLANLGQFQLAFSTVKPYFDKITVHAADSEKADSTPALPPVQEDITVEHLSFAYEGKPILKDASFRFRKGGKYALTGPSGCGKSTLLKLLLGWLPDYTGTIAFDGQDAHIFTTDALQQQMSYIEQDVFLFNTTIRENITLGESFTQEQLERAVRGSALDGDLKNMPLGLDTPVGEDGSCLSGGQKQRVAIARALIHNRSILLVDEGTSALDQKNADIVEQSLLNNPDLTLILVSHHLSEERKHQFDRVYELEPVAAMGK